MKVSKVIMIVVALHVLVIGGIFVFEGCSRTKVQAPQLADNESLPGQTPDALAPAAPGIPGTPADMTGLSATTPEGAIAPGALPTTNLQTPVAPEPQVATYAVKKGDSLWKIAKSENTTVAELMKANNLTKSSVLQIGQKLTIPAKTVVAEATGAASTTEMAATDGGSMYSVVSGDSLWKIANHNGTTVAELKKANHLTSDSLKVGQKLTIPGKSAATTTVAATTTTPTTPAVSGGVAPWSPSATFREPGTYQENNQTIHVVDLNDSPATIAKKYGVRVDDLMKANNITDPRQIHYGQSLIVPLNQPVSTTDAGSVAPIVSASNIN